MTRPFLAALAAGLMTSAAALAEPTVYVAGGTSNEVFVVDAATDQVVESFPGFANAHGLVATPDGEYVVAGSLKEDPKADKAENSGLYILHPAHGHVMSVIPVAGMTHHQAITPDGRWVLSTHMTRGAVSVMDMQSGEIVATVSTGPGPNYTLVSADGSTAFVSNSGNGTISEIAVADWSVRRTLEAGPAPEHMVFAPDEQTIFVTNPRGGTVSAVSVAGGAVARSYQVGPDVHGLDISDDGKTLFVTSKKDQKLTAIDIASDARRSLALEPSPYHLTAIRGTGKLYVSSSKAPTLWIVDQADLSLKGEIAIRGEGHQMSIVSAQ
ncbi:MAG: YncE family protein [Rhodospirillales bacterium]|nr:YncE family protein [Rhodospirillales bacterium]